MAHLSPCASKQSKTNQDRKITAVKIRCDTGNLSTPSVDNDSTPDGLCVCHHTLVGLPGSLSGLRARSFMWVLTLLASATEPLLRVHEGHIQIPVHFFKIWV